MSRDKILAAVKANQPETQELPSLDTIPVTQFANAAAQFVVSLQGIGGRVLEVEKESDVAAALQPYFGEAKKVIATVPYLSHMSVPDWLQQDPHTLDDVELGIIPSSLAVAENGAVWVTEKDVAQVRVLPFIVEHLVAVVYKKQIVSTMHDAYAIIGDAPAGFNVFIAGPSKTADIEQSLVLGAHGPKSMTVVIVNGE